MSPSPKTDTPMIKLMIQVWEKSEGQERGRAGEREMGGRERGRVRGGRGRGKGEGKEDGKEDGKEEGKEGGRKRGSRRRGKGSIVSLHLLISKNTSLYRKVVDKICVDRPPFISVLVQAFCMVNPTHTMRLILVR